MEFFGKTNINFIGFRHKAYIISAVIIIAGFISMGLRHGLKLSVEFKGGTLVQVKFDQSVPISDVRASMTRAGYTTAEIQQYGEAGDEYIVKVGGVEEKGYATTYLTEGLNKVAPGLKWRVVATQQLPPDLSKSFDGATLLTVEADSIPEMEGLTSRLRDGGYGVIAGTKETATRASIEIPLLGAETKVANAVKTELAKDFPGRTIEIRRTETIGPKVGKELQGHAWAALVVSLFGILVYVAWRFELKFAVGAVVAIVHDLLITIGLFSIFNREISLFVVAALLTIIGYSVNDTIVVFDRIRENFGLRRRETFEGMLNVSINETLSRTIITVLTVWIVTMFLLIMGGEFVRDFALAMTIGLVTGTGSSIFVASAIVYEWQNRISNRRKAVKSAA